MMTDGRVTMDTIKIDATERSPEVEFDFQAGRLRLAGESYPEDSAAFFAPLVNAVRVFLADGEQIPLTFDISLSYFNSSSAKALMNLFQDLEESAAKGRPIIVNWHYHPDDDTMAEFGEDFALDFENAEFRLCPASEGM